MDPRSFWPDYVDCLGEGRAMPTNLVARRRAIVDELRRWLHERRCAEYDVVMEQVALATNDDARKVLLGQLVRQAVATPTIGILPTLLGPLEECLEGKTRAGGRTAQTIALDNGRHQLWLYHIMARLVLDSATVWSEDELLRVHALMRTMERTASLPTVQELGVSLILDSDAQALKGHLIAQLRAQAVETDFLAGWRRILGDDKSMDEDDEGAGSARAPGHRQPIDIVAELERRATATLLPWEDSEEDELSALYV